MSLLNYNGNIIAEEQAPKLLSESVFRSKEGLFESMLLLDDEIQLLLLHYSRLQKGMLQLGYVFPFEFNIQFFEEEVLKTAKANNIYPFGRVRFQVFKETNGVCSFIAEVFEVTQSVFSFNHEGWVLGLVNNDWKSLDETAMLKAINTNLYTSASNMVKQNGWNDLLLVNNGFISESGTANLFIVKGNIVFTPPISEGCIAGVMRSFILSKLNEMKIQVHECPVSVEMLMNADEVFLTNAVRRIKWIKEIENKIFSTNKFSNSLSNKLFNN